ncbi:MAG: NGG1p interacting factor NIF3 [candidate division Zixibacteria bacterium]|nr:NGG1p interacting factor NIF3 [candidate division Zixibacteria bacterium]
MADKPRRYKVVVFVPWESLSVVRGAMARAGAGIIGDYTRCSFANKGRGTFRGGEGTSPAVGVAGRVEEVDEWRLEMVAAADVIEGVVAAMKAAHPYEEVAYDVYRLEDF